MKTEDRDQVLAVVQQLLEDNANNRITLSLVNGIVATARGLIHADPSAAAEPAPPAPQADAPVPSLHDILGAAP